MRILSVTIALAALLGLLAGCGKEKTTEPDSDKSAKRSDRKSPTPPAESAQEQPAKEEESIPAESLKRREPALSYSVVESWPEMSGQALAVDSKGNLFVVLPGYNKIRKCDPSGKSLLEWGSRGLGPGQFGSFGSGPEDIAVSSSDIIYIADQGNNRIQKFDSSGRFLGHWAEHIREEIPGRFGSFGPTAIAIDSQNNVYMITGPLIQKGDPSGQFQTQWGSEGSGDGQFREPRDIALDSSGNVYVADTGNDRIQKFDSSGKFLTKWGSAGAEDGQFNGPSGIAVDSTDYIYVTDSNNFRIQKFDPSGKFLTKWVSPGLDDRGSKGPRGIAVDRWGNVFVSHVGPGNAFVPQGESGRIRKFQPDRGEVGPIAAKPAESAAKEAGPRGSYIPVTPWGSAGSGDGQFNKPRYIAVDSSGNVFVADTDNSRVQKFDSSAKFLTKWGSPGTGDGQFRGPFGIAVDSSGNVLAADIYNARIQKFDSSGKFLTKWGTEGSDDGQFQYPTDVAADGKGNVYVADAGNDRIQKFDSSGKFLTKWGVKGRGDGQLDHPRHIAADPQGNVYVLDDSYRIQRFDSSGRLMTEWGSEAQEDKQLGSPRCIATDSKGNVYVGHWGGIQKFDSSGKFLTRLVHPFEEFRLPDGIAADSEENVYVLQGQRLYSRIVKFQMQR